MSLDIYTKIVCNIGKGFLFPKTKNSLMFPNLGERYESIEIYRHRPCHLGFYGSNGKQRRHRQNR